MTTLELDLREIIAEIIEKAPKDVGPDAHLIDDLGADSMMILEIVTAIEEKYRVVVPEEGVEKLTTLRRFVDLASSLGAQE